MALLLPPFRGGEVGRATLHVPGQRERRAAHLRERPARLDPDVDVDPARARCLRPADQPDRLERLARDQRHLADLRPLHARDRVQVDAQLVGMVEVLGADRVRVEVDAAEVVDPGQAGRVVDDDLVGGPPRREGQGRRPDELGDVLGCPLLEERLAGRAIDEALERHRPPAGAAQRPIRDRDVVLDEVELGVARLREVDLARVRDRHLAAVEGEGFLLGRHAQDSTPRQAGATGR